MGAYHQMGHDSWNLVEDRHIPAYKGLILSPVNSAPATVRERLNRLDTRDSIDVVLDPQLYNPRSNRGKLDQWGHFSPEQDTADSSSVDWWKKRSAALVDSARNVGANSIASPTFLPKAFSDDYYEMILEIADDFAGKAANANLAPLLSALVPLKSIINEALAMRLATIYSRSRLNRLYVIFHDELFPRSQRTDFQSVAAAMQFLRALRDSGKETLVAFTGIDVVMWKAGGATDVATGKYFNLRRFSPGRWEEESEKGRVISYWTDAKLLTWLREEDFRLLDIKGVIDRELAASNPSSREILAILDARRGEAWRGLSWRQYLYWFHETERAVTGPDVARTMLQRADAQWELFRQGRVLMIDTENDGRWVRAWLNALQHANI